VLGTLNPEQVQAIERILAGSDQILHVADQLLLFARIRAGKLEVRPREQTYAPIVEGVVASLEPLATRKGLTLEARLGYAGAGRVDPHAATQALTNLVDNAIRYTAAGGRVTVTTKRDGDEIVTEVEDTGTGIPPEDLPRLFGRFPQADGREYGGVGLGLRIVDSIVRAHGRELRVRSVPGTGSIFGFTLPAAV
jgi:two-component system phosphate regulon sensor histidine kinase PhoR